MPQNSLHQQEQPRDGITYGFVGQDLYEDSTEWAHGQYNCITKHITLQHSIYEQLCAYDHCPHKYAVRSKITYALCFLG